MLRRFLVVLIFFTGACAHAQPATTRGIDPAARVAFRGCAEIELSARDQLGRGFRIAGLSGIAYAGGDIYWAVMDNSDKLVRLRIEVGGDGSITSATVEGGLTLSDRRDFEGIAIFGQSVFLSEETTPGVSQYSLRDGRRMRTLVTPGVFLHGNTIRNRSFESMNITQDGKSLWTANEHALVSDGSPQTPVEPMGATTRVRMLRYALDAEGNAAPAEQLVYQTAGVHELAGFNSLVDLAALPNGKLIALERSGGQEFSGRRSIRTRIFLVSVDDAEDVSGVGALASMATSGPAARSLREVRQVGKQLLFDAKACDDDGENLEGLCLGPQLGEKRWALVGVVDDGDGPMEVSRTQVVVFELNLSATGKQR